MLKPEIKVYEQPNEGSHLAKVVGLIDMGTHVSIFKEKERKNKKVLFIYELQTKMKNGEPFILSKEYSQSMHEKATLRAHSFAYLKKKIRDSDIPTFSFKNFLGIYVELYIDHITKEGKTFSKITDISKTNEKFESVNESVLWELEDSADIPEIVNKFFAEKIKSSPEYQELWGTQSQDPANVPSGAYDKDGNPIIPEENTELDPF
jgi:hypothetical protein